MELDFRGKKNLKRGVETAGSEGGSVNDVLNRTFCYSNAA